MLCDITPVILTFNEAANLERALVPLWWARDIVVVDSFSTDGTTTIAECHPNVRLIQRSFDTHTKQWTFAVERTEIETTWILALDADYVLTPDFVEELRSVKDDGVIAAYRASFQYCIDGISLRSSLYPPVPVLFRRGHGHYVQDGHTQRLSVAGRIGMLKAKIRHDDRKPLSDWLLSQDRYMRLEAEHLASQDWSDLAFPDKVRRLPPLAPFLAFAYCYFGKCIFLDGRRGLYYALQRLLAEALLALRLIEIRRDGRK